MTILEAIQSNPILVNIPVSYIESVMISRSVSGSAIYESGSLKSLELITADLYQDVATLSEFKEGQLSIKYDSSALLARAASIYSYYDDDKATESKLIPINVQVTDVNA